MSKDVKLEGLYMNRIASLKCAGKLPDKLNEIIHNSYQKKRTE